MARAAGFEPTPKVLETNCKYIQLKGCFNVLGGMQMIERIVLMKLQTELELNNMGDHRKFKFVNEHLNDVDKTINFFIKILGYKPWQANKIRYNIMYKQEKYQNQKLNTSQ